MQLQQFELGEVVSGIFLGWTDWEFKPGKITLLPALRVDDRNISIMPSNYDLIAKFKRAAERGLLVEGETFVEVAFVGVKDMDDSRSPMKVFSVRVTPKNEKGDGYDKAKTVDCHLHDIRTSEEVLKAVDEQLKRDRD